MEVQYLTNENIDNYISFVENVFGYTPSNKSIERLIKVDKVLVIIKNEEIIASLVLEEMFEYIKCKKYYHISYLGVKKEYRRMGYATQLFNKVEELVKENNIDYIELNSGNQRKQAYYFYKDKQFKIKDSTVFVKIY